MATFIGRNSYIPIQITDELVIPANIDVALFVDYIHSQEKYFHDPGRFYPDRWLLEKGAVSNQGNLWCTEEAFFGFSGGPRVCPGREFAIANIKKFMLNLMGRYEFKALNNYGDCVPKQGIIQAPAKYAIQFFKRF